MPPLNWETERLVLKPATSADAQEAWESYTADPEVSRFMTWRPHASIDETEDFFRRCEDVWKQGAAWPWALRLKSDKSFAGMLEARIGPHVERPWCRRTGSGITSRWQ